MKKLKWVKWDKWATYPTYPTSRFSPLGTLFYEHFTQETKTMSKTKRDYSLVPNHRVRGALLEMFAHTNTAALFSLLPEYRGRGRRSERRTSR